MKNTFTGEAMLIGQSTIYLVWRLCIVSINSLIVDVRLSIK